MRVGRGGTVRWPQALLLAALSLTGVASCRSGRVLGPDAAPDVVVPDASADTTVVDTETEPAAPDAAVETVVHDAAGDPTPPSDGTDAAVPEKRCGDSPTASFSAYDQQALAKFADCTILVGRFQEDSVRDLMDLAALANVRRVEGTINIFRSPGFVTLHGLENLEEIEGNLFIHLNDNLTSIAALGKLRTITGDLYIKANPLLPQAEVEALGARVTVGGMKNLGSQRLE